MLTDAFNDQFDSEFVMAMEIEEQQQQQQQPNEKRKNKVDTKNKKITINDVTSLDGNGSVNGIIYINDSSDDDLNDEFHTKQVRKIHKKLKNF